MIFLKSNIAFDQEIKSSICNIAVIGFLPLEIDIILYELP